MRKSSVSGEAILADLRMTQIAKFYPNLKLENSISCNPAPAYNGPSPVYDLPV
jgi:hypothetical protein